MARLSAQVEVHFVKSFYKFLKLFIQSFNEHETYVKFLGCKKVHEKKNYIAQGKAYRFSFFALQLVYLRLI